jgi:hypothetical protein
MHWLKFQQEYFISMHITESHSGVKWIPIAKHHKYVRMTFRKWHKSRTDKDTGWIQLRMFHCHYKNITMKQKTWYQIFNIQFHMVATIQGIFLDAFTKLQRVTISFAMSSCVWLPNCLQLSAHPSTQNDSFHENWYLSIFRISAEKIQISWI